MLDLSYISKVTDDVKNTSLYHGACLFLLTQTLMTTNRMDDLDRALKDVSYREQLIHELHIAPDDSISQ